MTKPIIFFDWFFPDIQGADHKIMELLIERLRSGDLSKSDMGEIADMLDPKGRTTFRLRLVRRPGTGDQMGEKWFEQFQAFWDIYDAVDGDEKEALNRAELSAKDGGIGKDGLSRPTARKYLAALKAHLSAQREALEEE